MEEMTDTFGLNAGKLWQMLHNHGTLKREDIITRTNLRDSDVNIAIGWLARENKVSVEQEALKLGETNLTEKVGLDAGKIWNILHKNNELDLSSLINLLHITEDEAYCALGWLSREGKIKVGIREKKPYETPLIENLSLRDTQHQSPHSEWPSIKEQTNDYQEQFKPNHIKISLV